MLEAVSWFDTLRDLPERLFTDEVVKVVEECDDLCVLLELIVADTQTVNGLQTRLSLYLTVLHAVCQRDHDTVTALHQL